jgi:hypothetical protein
MSEIRNFFARKFDLFGGLLIFDPKAKLTKIKNSDDSDKNRYTNVILHDDYEKYKDTILIKIDLNGRSLNFEHNAKID